MVPENGLNCAAPQNSQVTTETRESPRRREVSSHALNEGVIRTHQRHQGLRGPKPRVSSRHVGERECAARPRGALRPPANVPGKAAFGGNSDAAWQNIKRCLSLQLLHPSPSSERWSTVPLSHLTGKQHAERWWLHSHAPP